MHNWETRRAIIENLRQCYRADSIFTRQHVDLILFRRADQRAAPCYSARVTLTPAVTQLAYPVASPPLLYWTVSHGTPLQAALQCQRQRDDILFVEAEAFDEFESYTVRDDAVSDASGQGVIADEPGPDTPRAAVTVKLGRPGVYALWARTYRLRADGFPLYLTVNDAVELPPISVDPPLNAWHWERAGVVELAGNAVRLVITRPYEGEKPFGVYVDAVLLTTDLRFSPDQSEARWAGFFPGAPADLPAPGLRQGVFSLVDLAEAASTDLEPGVYRCRAGVWDGERLRDNAGRAGVWSEWVQLSLTAGVSPRDQREEGRESS